MKRLTLLTSLFAVAGTTLQAQQVTSSKADIVIASSEATGMEAEQSADPAAPYTIFSNVGTKDDAYNTFAAVEKPIIGRQVRGITEQWDAVRFVPKVDAQASVLEAAVAYVAGTRAVQLGIYASDGAFGYPGTLLAQGSTTQMPDDGACCQLAKVTLPQPVTLTARTIYWLVASPGSSDFNGVWRVSHVGENAFLHPPGSWVLAASAWPAGRVSGTKLQTLGPVNSEKQESTRPGLAASNGGIQLYSNLNPVFPEPYVPGVGLVIFGNDVPFESETWDALPFTTKRDSRAKTLAAAVSGAISLQPIINLGIYSDNAGLPGSPLDGGQGTATDVPNTGQCCDFATVRLPGKGVALTGGVQYWLVASPNTEEEKFNGLWQVSTNAIWAKWNPEQSAQWTGYNGEWMAAEIIGSND